MKYLKGTSNILDLDMHPIVGSDYTIIQIYIGKEVLNPERELDDVVSVLDQE